MGRKSFGPGSVVALALVAIVHIVLYRAIVAGMGGLRVPRALAPIDLTVFAPRIVHSEPPPPPLSWTLQAPEDIEVPEPDIQLSSDPTLPAGTVFGGPPQLVLPRPDPAYVNDGLLVPAELARLSVELRILVLQDGSVGDAKIERSSGQGDLDKLAVEHVEREWRFIPAYLGTKPIAHWIFVLVRCFA